MGILKPKYKIILIFAAMILVLVGCNIGRISSREGVNDNTNSAVDVPGGQVAMLSSNIIINAPLAEAVVVSPLPISGRAIGGEGPVRFRLIDGWKNIMATSTAAISAQALAWGDFFAQLIFPKAHSQNGWLEIYSINPQTGSEQNLTRIEVFFKDWQLPAIKVFFSNINNDPKLKNCGTVYPVERRLAPTDQLPQAVMAELFKGASETEMKAGLVNNIPETGVTVQKVDFQDGKIYIDFNQALQQDVKGVCRVEAIKAQITETLKQFPNVKEVVISIDGKTDGILKP